MEEKEIVTEKVNEEKKSGGNKVLVVIIVILLLIVAFGFGYFLGTGNLSSDEKEDDKVVDESKEEKEEVLEQLTKDSKVVTDLFAIYKEVENGSHDITRDYDLSKDYVKKSVAVKELIKENKISERNCGSFSEFKVGDAMCYPYELVYNTDGTAIDYEKTKEASKNNKAMIFNSSDLKSKYLELYGQNAEYKDASFDLTIFPCGYAYYDETNNIYGRYNKGCGSAVADATHTLDSIEQNGTSLKLITTLKVADEPTVKIEYTFEYEKATGNYIFVSRVEK